jgi:hypothetical protein
MRHLVSITIFLGICLACGESKQKINVKKGCKLDNETLFVDLAERILIDKYGRNEILEQRPYKVDFVKDSVWIMKGTLPPGFDGGTFYIEMSCKDFRVLKRYHGK